MPRKYEKGEIMKRFLIVLIAATILAPLSARSAVLGDINGDNRVDISEVVYALQVSAGLSPPLPQLPFSTVISAGGRVWMDRNLGASQVATSTTDPLAAGDLYQWGRSADGHQSLTSSTTTTLSHTDVPGHGDFILVTQPPDDWRDEPNVDLWQGESGMNNPCPFGFRLPTEEELVIEQESWDFNNSIGAFRSPLKLVETGIRNHTSGTVINLGYGYYWSSTVDGGDSRVLRFCSFHADMDSYNRADGASVRCIQGP